MTVKGLIEVGVSGQSLFDLVIEQVFARAASIAPLDVIEAGEGSERGRRVAIAVEDESDFSGDGVMGFDGWFRGAVSGRLSVSLGLMVPFPTLIRR